jgi:hypothetical protein
MTENGLDLLDSVVDSVTKDGDPVIHIVEARKSICFALIVAELAHCLLYTLERAAKTFAAISDNPLLVVREFINGLSRHDQGYFVRFDYLLQRTERLLVAIILGDVEPDAGVNQTSEASTLQSNLASAHLFNVKHARRQGHDY